MGTSYTSKKEIAKSCMWRIPPRYQYMLEAAQLKRLDGPWNIGGCKDEHEPPMCPFVKGS